MNYMQEQRKMILNQIKNTFIELNKKIHKDPNTKFIDENKLIYEISYAYGCRTEKAKEYIQELIANDIVFRDKYGLSPGRVIVEGWQETLKNE
jgi:hypothetical protein